MSKQVMGFGMVYIDKQGNEVVEHVRGNYRGKIGGLAENRPLFEEEEIVIENGGYARLTASDRNDFMVDYSSYTISVSLKDGQGSKSDDLSILTYWVTHKDHSLSGYSGQTVSTTEEIIGIRNGNYVTKSNYPKTDRLNHLRVYNRTGRTVTAVVQFYRHTYPINDDDTLYGVSSDGEKQPIRTNETGHVGIYNEISRAYEEVEKTISSGGTLKIPVTGKAKHVEYADYNVSVSLKNESTLNEDDIEVFTLWSTHRDQTVGSDYGEALFLHQEQIIGSRRGNFVTERESPKTARLEQVRVVNKSGKEIKAIVQFYMYSTPSSSKNIKIEHEEPDTSPQIQHVESQEYNIIKSDDNDFANQYGTSKPSYLQSFYLQTDRPDLAMDIRISDGEGRGFIRDITGTWISMESIQEIGGEDDLFKVVKYDEDEGIYVMVLKHPIYCPYGFKFVLPQYGTSFARFSMIHFNEIVSE